MYPHKWTSGKIFGQSESAYAVLFCFVTFVVGQTPKKQAEQNRVCSELKSVQRWSPNPSNVTPLFILAHGWKQKQLSE